MSEKSKTCEIIDNKVANKEGFLLNIVRCKNKNEVLEYLLENDINATEKEVDYLAKNIKEIADICRSMSDEELEHIVGGGFGNTLKEWCKIKSDKVPEGNVDNETYEKWYAGLGIGGWSLIGLGGAGVLTVIAADIRQLGKRKGWWD